MRIRLVLGKGHMLLLGLTFDSLESSIDHVRFEDLVPAVGHASTILDSVKIVSPASRSIPKVYRAIFDTESVQAAAMYCVHSRGRLSRLPTTRHGGSNAGENAQTRRNVGLICNNIVPCVDTRYAGEMCCCAFQKVVKAKEVVISCDPST
jgi:hypothetical protein